MMKLFLEKLFRRNSPAQGAFLGLALLCGIGSFALLFLFSIFLIFFSLLPPVGFDAATGGTLTGIVIFAAAGLGGWIYATLMTGYFYWNLLRSKTVFAAAFVIAAAGVALFGRLGGFAMPESLIPTYIRRELWCGGAVFFAVPLTVYLFIGVLLPLWISIRRGMMLLAGWTAFCGLGAIFFGIFTAGMVSNDFKYFSLGGLSDIKSFSWEHPHSVAAALAITLALALGAGVLRVIFWRKISEEPCIRPLVLGGGAVVAFWLCGVAVMLYGDHIRNRRLREYHAEIDVGRFIETYCRHQPSSESGKWLAGQLSSMIFVISYEDRFLKIVNEDEMREIAAAVEMRRELFARIDDFCDRQPQRLPLPGEVEFSIRFDPQPSRAMLRISRVYGPLLAAALYRGDRVEALKLWRRQRNLTEFQSAPAALIIPERAWDLDTAFLNRSEQMLNGHAFDAAGLDELQEFISRTPERLEAVRGNIRHGGLFRAHSEVRNTMYGREWSLSPRRLRWFVPALWTVLNDTRYRTVVDYKDNSAEAYGKITARYRALAEAAELERFRLAHGRYPERYPVWKGEVAFTRIGLSEGDLISHNSRPTRSPEPADFIRLGSGDADIRLIVQEEAK